MTLFYGDQKLEPRFSPPEQPENFAAELQWYSEVCRNHFVGKTDLGKARQVEKLIQEKGAALATWMQAGIIEGNQRLPLSQDSSFPIGIEMRYPSHENYGWEIASSKPDQTPTPIFRRVDALTCRPRTLYRGIHVVVVSPRPHGEAYFDHRAEANTIMTATEVFAGEARVTIVSKPTTQGVIAALHQARLETPHSALYLHFDGHGSVGANGDAQLCFETSSGNLDLVTLTALSPQIAEVALENIYLSSCMSGKGGRGPFASMSVAFQIAQTLNCAVVAMGFTVSVPFALRFCEAFYRCVMSGVTPGASAIAARNACWVFEKNSSSQLQEWHVPRIYLPERLASFRLGALPAVTLGSSSSEGFATSLARVCLEIERLVSADQQLVVVDAFFDANVRDEIINAVSWLNHTARSTVFFDGLDAFEARQGALDSKAVVYGGRLSAVSIARMKVLSEANLYNTCWVFCCSRFSAIVTEVESLLGDAAYCEMPLSDLPTGPDNPAGPPGNPFWLFCQENWINRANVEPARSFFEAAGNEAFCPRWPSLIDHFQLSEVFDAHIGRVILSLPEKIARLAARLALFTGAAHLSVARWLLCKGIGGTEELEPDRVEARLDEGTSHFVEAFKAKGITLPAAAVESFRTILEDTIAKSEGALGKCTEEEFQLLIEILSIEGLAVVRFAGPNSSVPSIHISLSVRTWLARRNAEDLELTNFAFVECILQDSKEVLQIIDNEPHGMSEMLEGKIPNLQAALLTILSLLNEPQDERVASSAVEYGSKLSLILGSLFRACGSLDQAERMQALHKKFNERLTGSDEYANSISQGLESFPLFQKAFTAAEYFRAGEYERAINMFKEVVPAVYTEIEGTPAARFIPEVVTAYANAAHIVGEIDLAKEICEQFLATEAAENASPGMKAGVLSIYGLALRSLQQTEEAIKVFQASVSLQEGTTDQGSLAIALTNYGGALLEREEWSLGEKVMRRAIGIKRELGMCGPLVGLETNLESLGFAASRQGRIAEALQWLDEAGNLHRENGSILGECVCLTKACFATRFAPGFEVEHAERLELLRTRSVGVEFDAHTHAMLFELLGPEPSLPKAELELGLKYFEELGPTAAVSAIVKGIQEAIIGGRFEEGARVLRHAFPVFSKSECREGVAFCFLSAAALELTSTKSVPREAMKYAMIAWIEFKQLGNAAKCADALELAASAFGRAKQFDLALLLGQCALNQFAELGLSRRAAHLLFQTANLVADSTGEDFGLMNSNILMARQIALAEGDDGLLQRIKPLYAKLVAFFEEPEMKTLEESVKAIRYCAIHEAAVRLGGEGFDEEKTLRMAIDCSKQVPLLTRPLLPLPTYFQS